MHGSHSKTTRVTQTNLKNPNYFLFEFDQEERQDDCSFLSSHVQSLFFLFLSSSLSAIISFVHLRPSPTYLSFSNLFQNRMNCDSGLIQCTWVELCMGHTPKRLGSCNLV